MRRSHHLRYRLGYSRVAFVEAFQEWEMELVVDDQVRDRLSSKFAELIEEEYRDEEDDELVVS